MSDGHSDTSLTQQACGFLVDNINHKEDTEIIKLANGIALCQGNFTLMTDDLPSVIRHFGEQDKIYFVHFRDVRGTPAKFTEAFHDDGQTDLAAGLRAYRDVGYDGGCRPDHCPKMGDENFRDDLRLAHLFAVDYFKGLREAVYSEPLKAES